MKIATEIIEWLRYKQDIWVVYASQANAFAGKWINNYISFGPRITTDEEARNSNLATLYKMYNSGAMGISKDVIKFNLTEILTEDNSVPLQKSINGIDSHIE